MPETSKTVEWYTPPEILLPLGSFDLDPCSPSRPPFKIADQTYTKEQNGLILPWYGRVWLNPPYGRVMKLWMKKMAEHREGLALVFARTDTDTFHQWIFPFCDSMLFIDGRVKFLHTGGVRAKSDGKAPSLLIAYGERNVEALEDSRIRGKHVLVNSCPIIIVGVSPSWKDVVKISLGRLNGEGSLQQIYDVVELLAPDKINNNSHFKAKVRQVLQFYFTRIAKGVYAKR